LQPRLSTEKAIESTSQFTWKRPGGAAVDRLAA